MASPRSTQIYGLILALVAVMAVVVGIFKIRVPGRQVDLNLTPPILNASSPNVNSTRSFNTPMTYTFPGRLSDDRIHDKQARIVTNKGEIIFMLDDVQAPLAVSSFVYLAEQKYFDGLTWHRVVPDFVIQGGDPTGTGTGGPGYQFPDEPVTGEYVEGTVAMANAGPNTNGSQFFITTTDDRQKLAKNYTIFGHLTSGLDVVKAIAQGDVMEKVTIEPAA